MSATLGCSRTKRVYFSTAIGLTAVAAGLACLSPFGRSIALDSSAVGRKSPRNEYEAEHSPHAKQCSIAASARQQVIEVGHVAAGGYTETEFSLENHSATPLEIAKILTSCPCVSIEMARCTIAPGGAMTAIARIDLSGEPEFTGGLCAEARFIDGAKRELFRREFNLSVTSANNIADFPALRGHALGGSAPPSRDEKTATEK